MGTILRFRAPSRKAEQQTVPDEDSAGEIVIFPGVRIERHELDLAYRLRDAAGQADVGDIDGGRPRKTS